MATIGDVLYLVLKYLPVYNTEWFTWQQINVNSNTY